MHEALSLIPSIKKQNASTISKQHRHQNTAAVVCSTEILLLRNYWPS